MLAFFEEVHLCQDFDKKQLTIFGCVIMSVHGEIGWVKWVVAI